MKIQIKIQMQIQIQIHGLTCQRASKRVILELLWDIPRIAARHGIAWVRNKILMKKRFFPELKTILEDFQGLQAGLSLERFPNPLALQVSREPCFALA